MVPLGLVNRKGTGYVKEGPRLDVVQTEQHHFASLIHHLGGRSAMSLRSKFESKVGERLNAAQHYLKAWVSSVEAVLGQL